MNEGSNRSTCVTMNAKINGGVIWLVNGRVPMSLNYAIKTTCSGYTDYGLNKSRDRHKIRPSLLPTECCPMTQVYMCRYLNDGVQILGENSICKYKKLCTLATLQDISNATV